MITQLLSLQLEAGLNAYLKTVDPTKLIQLDDLLLKMNLTGLNITIILHFMDGKVQVLPSYDSEATLEISGTPLAFCRLSMEDARILSAEGSLEIRGEISQAQSVLDVFKSAAIDWPSWVRGILGESATHVVEESFVNATQTVKTVSESVQLNLTDYIQEEIRLLPPREMINDFCDDVDDLVLNVERIKARIQHLENKEG